MIITIDGPTASGKSTIGRMLAKKLNCYYIYSGLLYRALAYILMKQYGYTLDALVHAKKEDISAVFDPKRFEYSYNGGEKIIFDEKDITSFLKESMIDQAASIVSTNKEVRAAIDQLQKIIANDHKVVVDGRDAGTVVFPHAHYKFFLTASPVVRAKRWHAQHQHTMSFDEAIQFLAIRDTRDSSREHAPLKKAPDGIEIDNSSMSLDETLELILQKIRQ